MAIPENILTDADVYDLINPAEFAQLTNRTGDGTVDPALMLSAQRRATTEVLGWIENQNAIDGLQPPYPRLWVTAAAPLAVLAAWLKGATGLAFPPKYQTEVDNVRTVILPQIAAGKMGNVAPVPPLDNQSLRQVTHHSAFTLARMKGLY